MNPDFLRDIEFEDMTFRYIRHNNSGGVQLILFPTAAKPALEERRENLTGRTETARWDEKCPLPAGFDRDNLLQIKLAEEPWRDWYSGGVTLFDSPGTASLRLISHQVHDSESHREIETVFHHPLDLICTHHVIYRHGESGVEIFCDVQNQSEEPVTLELLSSFVLNGITPFDDGESTGRLKLHRFRSWWSAEGRLESRTLEELHLERSWAPTGARSERFGQVGSMPVRKFFPFIAAEDTETGVVWAAKLAWAGSWQMEAVRRGDTLSLTGGLADRELGHWMKKLLPGESLISPRAQVSCSDKGLEDVCQRLVRMQESRMPCLPEEEDLPIVFNEWCSSWGNPTRENVLHSATALEGIPVRYFVIDAGWSERPEGTSAQTNGDWVVDEKRFPGGLKKTADALRGKGLIPGIWFEFEVCVKGSQAYTRIDHVLHRDGRPLDVGARRFWDLRDLWVQNYLAEKVIRFLRENGFGYLKVDYNDTIGLGCDHPDSLGEGLRLQVVAVQNFFRRLRRELPDLVIENCASGGHRLEPSMMELSSMSSFSDAHEGQDIPIIAANLQRLVPARQSQIWAVLRAKDSAERTVYSLAATFLGRMCLSGDVRELLPEQMQIIREAAAFYEAVAPVIKDGVSSFFGPPQNSYREPIGWQAVVRYSANCRLAFAVIHNFNPPFPEEIDLPLQTGSWRIMKCFPPGISVNSSGDRLFLAFKNRFSAQAVLLEKEV